MSTISDWNKAYNDELTRPWDLDWTWDTNFDYHYATRGDWSFWIMNKWGDRGYRFSFGPYWYAEESSCIIRAPLSRVKEEIKKQLMDLFPEWT